MLVLGRKVQVWNDARLVEDGTTERRKKRETNGHLYTLLHTTDSNQLISSHSKVGGVCNGGSKKAMMCTAKGGSVEVKGRKEDKVWKCKVQVHKGAIGSRDHKRPL